MRTGCGRQTGSAHHGRGLLWLALALLIVLPIAGGAAFSAPFVLEAYSTDLPQVGDLSSQFAFRTTQILDRNGKLLYEVNDQNGGRRLPVDIGNISRDLINGTIATEDKDFYTNPGVDFVGIGRAVVQNITQGRVTQGGSTITQQLAKNILIDKTQKADRTYRRKLVETVLALRISQRYSKDEILEMYLNEAYYGHQAYGVEAAAQTYFGKHAKDLDLAEASLIAGLPQAPSEYDPLLHLDAARERQSIVLQRMVEENYVSVDQAARAKSEKLSFKKQQNQTFEAPHFVVWVRQLLEQQYGPDAVYRQGLKVTTTLDLDLNKLAETSIKTHMDSLKQQEATNASLVALDPKTGEILAMVGSVDFFDEKISGEVNVATSPRQPGSTIKPIEYAAAFMKGWGPQTIITDEATDFPKPAGGPPYRPHNFDGKFDGAMTVRYALANSKNIPAVKTLMYVGIPDFVRTASQLGLQIEQPDTYGLSLALGAAPVPLVNMVGAYTAFDDYGTYHAPAPFLKVEDWEGNVLYDSRQAAGTRVFGEEQAYMITSILSDNLARTPLQGPDSPLKLSRPAAAKTGSTDDYKDSWTIGYTPDLVAGVWVGNTDNSAMKEVVGSLGAGRIWHDFMESALKGKPAKEFTPPASIKEYRICKDTGKPATPDCNVVITEVWPTTYTPAQYADIPGLPKTPGGGRVLGLTLSPQGGLPVPPTPTPAPATATATPGTPTPGTPEAVPTHEIPTPWPTPQPQQLTPVSVQSPVPTRGAPATGATATPKPVGPTPKPASTAATPVPSRPATQPTPAPTKAPASTPVPASSTGPATPQPSPTTRPAG